jgi:hypothetical protein
MKHKAELKNKAEDKAAEEIEQLRHDKYLSDLKAIINEAIDPMKNDIAEIKIDLQKVQAGTQATCRNDLEEMYLAAEKKGYCSNEDKEKFEATYQAYHALGKNGVMDVKREKLLKLPEIKAKLSKETKNGCNN